MVLCKWWCVDLQKGRMVEQELKHTSAGPMGWMLPIRNTELRCFQCSKCYTCHEKTRLKLLQVLHLPCKTRRRCHAKRGGAQSNQLSPDFRGPLRRCSNVLHLPRKTLSPDFRGPLRRCSNVLHLPRKMSLKLVQVLRLPRKTSLKVLPRKTRRRPK